MLVKAVERQVPVRGSQEEAQEHQTPSQER